MKKNLVSIELSAEDLAKLDTAITMIDEVFTSFISLSAKEVHGLNKMGSLSEPFCRQTLLVLGQNRGGLPPDFDLAEFERDLRVFDALKAPLLRLQELVARAEDTSLALGSDVLNASLEGYRLMKMFGQSEGLESLRDAMSARRQRGSRPAAAADGPGD